MKMKISIIYENIYDLKMILRKITTKDFFAHYYFPSGWHLIRTWRLTKASCRAPLE